jgi:hypothetical protein
MNIDEAIVYIEKELNNFLNLLGPTVRIKMEYNPQEKKIDIFYVNNKTQKNIDENEIGGGIKTMLEIRLNKIKNEVLR